VQTFREGFSGTPALPTVVPYNNEKNRNGISGKNNDGNGNRLESHGDTEGNHEKQLDPGRRRKEEKNSVLPKNAVNNATHGDGFSMPLIIRATIHADKGQRKRKPPLAPIAFAPRL